MSNVIQTIEIAATEALGIIDAVLPIVEKAAPFAAAAGGPIGLGVSAAAALLPLLQKIPIGPEFTVEQQQSYLDRIKIQTLLDFSAPAWKLSTATPVPVPVPAPPPQPPAAS